MTLTQEEIDKRITAQGWELVETYSEEVGYIARCKKGHLMRIPFNRSAQVTSCPYCRGMKATIDMVRQSALEDGFELVDYTESKDPAGNIYLKKASRVTLRCKNGHLQTSTTHMVVSHEAVCSACKAKRASTTYSRSEEIIAGVLDHLTIRYSRTHYTSVELGQLRLDFFLPERKVIIEYDGKQHQYGRTTDTQPLSQVKMRDELKDRYARARGFKMIRINHTNIGKELVYVLAREMPYLNINPYDPFYDDLVQRVYDYAHEMYGWDSYEKIKGFASQVERDGFKLTSEITGQSISKLRQDVTAVYGKNGGI